MEKPFEFWEIKLKIREASSRIKSTRLLNDRFLKNMTYKSLIIGIEIRDKELIFYGKVV